MFFTEFRKDDQWKNFISFWLSLFNSSFYANAKLGKVFLMNGSRNILSNKFLSGEGKIIKW